MARIAGLTLPKDKPVEIALRYLYGVGPMRARQVLAITGVDGRKRTKDLSNEEEDKLRAYIEKNFRVEGELRRDVMSNVKRLKEIGCYRGMRHQRHLPVRGQRTKTNSRTVRGNTRKTMGSGRKDANAKT
ncbi:MAG: 30S ribosomal protein S13 [bacterium]